ARTSTGIARGNCPTAGPCLLTAIERDMAMLSSNSASAADKLKSLKLLGRWVADIHQPLHVSFDDDRGGNNINVYGECTTNLHSAWDTCLVQKAIGPDVLVGVSDLLRTITPGMKEEWNTTNPRDWANESFAIARAPATKYCVQHGSSCDP